MLEFSTFALFTFIILFIEILYLRIAKYYHITDHPNERSSHHSITIRGGGIIFPITILLVILFSGFKYPYFSIGLFLISFISFWDDLHNISNKIRIVIHLAAVSLVFLELGFYDYSFWIVIGGYVVVIGIINAYNFMDGINGMTGLYSLTTVMTLLVLNRSMNFIENQFLVYTSVSLLVFLYFNYRKKAKCFAGDVGSVSMAFIILFALILLINQTHQPLYLLFLALYGIDTVFTIIFRLINNENIFKAHRSHVYQLLSNERGFSHLKVSFFYALIQSVINCLVIYCVNRNLSEWFNIVFAFIILLSLGIVYLLIKKKDNLIYS